MKKIITLAALALFTWSGVQAQTIHTETSKVTFEISNMGVRTVEGSFHNMTGTVNFDPNNLAESSMEACIEAATVNTDNEDRDAHLRNEDFFHTDKYPTICIKSKSVSKNGSGYTMVATLSMHGVTKEMTIPFTMKGNTYTGTFTVNRLDYKVGEDTNTFMVGDEVEITIKSDVEL